MIVLKDESFVAPLNPQALSSTPNFSSVIILFGTL